MFAADSELIMQGFLIALSFGVFLYAIVILFLYNSDMVVVPERMKKILKQENISDVQDQVWKEKREKDKKKNRQSRLASKELMNYLAMSGIKLSASEFLSFWAVLTFVPMLLVIVFRGNIVTALALGVIGFAVPPILVKRARKKQQDEFNKQLGDSLVIMGNCVKAGFSFQQALESIAKEMQPPISTEFKKVLLEIRYGVSMEEALRHMVDRVKNKDLDLLVSAVLTSMQVGGNLSDILDVISQTIKDRLKIKAEIRVLTSSGRTSGTIIGLLPIFIIIVLMLLNPQYFQSFFQDVIGKIMIALSVILETTGFLVIRKIVDIEY